MDVRGVDIAVGFRNFSEILCRGDSDEMIFVFLSFSSGELQEVSRPVEAARGEDVRAGPGEGRDPHEGALVRQQTRLHHQTSTSIDTRSHLTVC